MNIDTLKRTKLKIDFRELESTLDQLLSKKVIKDLTKELQGEKDKFVIQDVITQYVLDNLSIDDISVENIDIEC